jgi:hypothetical protein
MGPAGRDSDIFAVKGCVEAVFEGAARGKRALFPPSPTTLYHPSAAPRPFGADAAGDSSGRCIPSMLAFGIDCDVVAV